LNASGSGGVESSLESRMGVERSPVSLFKSLFERAGRSSKASD
jgi:hypothetical protein